MSSGFVLFPKKMESFQRQYLAKIRSAQVVFLAYQMSTHFQTLKMAFQDFQNRAT